MKKVAFRIVYRISVVLVILAFLSLFGATIKHVVNGGERLGKLTNPVITFINFPNLVLESFAEISKSMPSYGSAIDSKQAINDLEYDLYVLQSFYMPEPGGWEIQLINVKTDSTLHSWYLHKKDYIKYKLAYNRSVALNSILLKDNSIIVLNDESPNLYRINAESEVIWKNNSTIFHHSLNLGEDGNIWACAAELRRFRARTYNMRASVYRDDFITKVDVETGEILFKKGVAEILIENGYHNLVYGIPSFWNTTDGFVDPIHLNDIEPVLENHNFLKKGDLLLSIRTPSMIIHYRPETNKIERLVFGPFLNQHDVDIIGKDSISIFNNNAVSLDLQVAEPNHSNYMIPPNDEKTDSIKYSNVITYDFSDSTFKEYYPERFESESIYSETQGLHEILSNGDIFIESTRELRIYVMNHQRTLLRKQYPTSMGNTFHMPSWSRVYEYNPLN